VDKLCFGIDETTRLTGLGRTTIYREIAAGHLEVIKVGSRTLVTRAALERFLETCARGLSAE